MYRELQVESPDLGPLSIDIAYGGNFYPIMETQDNFRDISDFTPAELLRMGVELRQLIDAEHEIVHPQDPSIRGLKHCMWTGAATRADADARNCVIAGEMIDRSPCGTCTSARLAQRAAKSLLKEGDCFVHESHIGSTFTGTLEGHTQVGDYAAIIPGIEGSAYITGLNTLFVDTEEPFSEGFIL